MRSFRPVPSNPEMLEKIGCFSPTSGKRQRLPVGHKLFDGQNPIDRLHLLIEGRLGLDLGGLDTPVGDCDRWSSRTGCIPALQRLF